MQNFPDHFIFGAATASYQIEGAWDVDGKLPSIWDTFTHQKGNIYQNQNGDDACDHYNRYSEDIKIMKSLGLQAYRFSISWPRVLDQNGKINPKGLDFYNSIVDQLLENGIKPAVTLYHWDLPQWIQDKGGWCNRDTVYRFADYSSQMFSKFNDRVDMWITHNEPFCASFLGHQVGEHAPGHRDLQEGLSAAHHILLSHGEAVRRYRQFDQEGKHIGITCNHMPIYPASDSTRDMQIAQIADGYFNRWFLEPLFKKQYPSDMLEFFEKEGARIDFVQDEDLEIISEKTNFYGINFYTKGVFTYDPDGMFQTKAVDTGKPKTEMGWEVVPESLFDCIKRIADEYTSLPLYITENGSAFVDTVENGKVHDTKREGYLVAHLQQVHRLIDSGVDMRGYFCWSFMDNFEWAYGFSKRFGLVHVNYETQERIIKQSGYRYRKIIEERAV